MAQSSHERKSRVDILRTTLRVERLSQRIANLRRWSGISIISEEVRASADQTLLQLPSVIRRLRRTSATFTPDEIW